jgi:hypothetical protein
MMDPQTFTNLNVENPMAASPLHPDNIPAGPDRSLGRGHGIDALGPSDSSDSGSDMQGAPGTTPESDTDSTGTGERAASSGEAEVSEGADVAPDHIESVAPEGEKKDKPAR